MCPRLRHGWWSNRNRTSGRRTNLTAPRWHALIHQKVVRTGHLLPVILNSTAIGFSPVTRKSFWGHNTDMNTNRVAIYCRVSTADQSAEQQGTALREYCAARGWNQVTEYVDQISGSKDSRPSLNKLLADARLRKVDCIVVWKLDRWSRSLSHLVTSLQELESLGIRFIAMTQGIDTDQSSPTARLFTGILGCMAEFERSLIQERVVAGMNRARKAGTHCGRPRLVVNRDKICEQVSQGLGLAHVAKLHGISVSSVERILASFRAQNSDFCPK
jgi:DNA invertase Pin-like site-specific DNA recombinase